MKIAINGFGRIGRLFARVLMERGSEHQIVAVNDLTDAETLAYLFQYDSNYGVFDGTAVAEDNHLTIQSGDVEWDLAVSAEKDPSKLPWKDLGVDLVIECTGRFLTTELSQLHLDAGANKVLLSAPAKSEEIPTVVLGVNEVPDAKVVSNASCTTNCISPAIKALNDVLDIQSISGVTVHAYTASQNIQDGPNKKVRTGRAAAVNIVPTTTGAAKAAIKVIPDIAGKLSISALRVPVLSGSYVYLTFKVAEPEEDLTRDHILGILADYALNNPNILTVLDAPLVSSDIVKSPFSTTVDAEQVKITGKGEFEIGVWYDNEWGYTNRLVDTALAMLGK